MCLCQIQFLEEDRVPGTHLHAATDWATPQACFSAASCYLKTCTACGCTWTYTNASNCTVPETEAGLPDTTLSLRCSRMHVHPACSPPPPCACAPTWPTFQSSVLMMVHGHTKPPSEGPSTVSTTGWSPVKLMAPAQVRSPMEYVRQTCQASCVQGQDHSPPSLERVQMLRTVNRAQPPERLALHAPFWVPANACSAIQRQGEARGTWGVFALAARGTHRLRTRGRARCLGESRPRRRRCAPMPALVPPALHQGGCCCSGRSRAGCRRCHP